MNAVCHYWCLYNCTALEMSYKGLYLFFFNSKYKEMLLPIEILGVGSSVLLSGIQELNLTIKVPLSYPCMKSLWEFPDVL